MGIAPASGAVVRAFADHHPRTTILTVWCFPGRSCSARGARRTTAEAAVIPENPRCDRGWVAHLFIVVEERWSSLTPALSPWRGSAMQPPE